MNWWPNGAIWSSHAGFAYKRFEGQIRAPGPLDEVDEQLWPRACRLLRAWACSMKGSSSSAPIEVRRLSQRVNQYLNEKAPWLLIKEDPAAAATAVDGCLTGHRLAKTDMGAFCRTPASKFRPCWATRFRLCRQSTHMSPTIGVSTCAARRPHGRYRALDAHCCP